MARKKKASLTKLYACGTVGQDLAIGHTEVTFYSSMKALKKSSTCWQECGIISIEFNPKTLKKANFKIR